MKRVLAISSALTLMLAGAAYAQTGDTSGTSSGGNVKPSSAMPSTPAPKDKSGTIGGTADTEKTSGVQGPAGSENGAAPDKAKDMK